MGRAGTMKPEIDLRSDYLLLPVDDAVKPVEVLEFDARSLPTVGERVWLPDKDSSAESGHHNVAGTVTEATEKYLVVELDVAIKLQSQSGSPFISQETSKVVGMLSTANAAAPPETLPHTGPRDPQTTYQARFVSQTPRRGGNPDGRLMLNAKIEILKAQVKAFYLCL